MSTLKYKCFTADHMEMELKGKYVCKVNDDIDRQFGNRFRKFFKRISQFNTKTKFQNGQIQSIYNLSYSTNNSLRFLQKFTINGYSEVFVIQTKTDLRQPWFHDTI